MGKEKPDDGRLTREEKILLEEYKAAQDSAQHHCFASLGIGQIE